jgi:hypothetical protein
LPVTAVKAAPRAWQTTALPGKSDSPRLSRRLLAHRLLLLYTVALLALLLYALDLHPAHLRALRASFGTLRRVAAMQATVTAGFLLLYAVLFYFCIMAPLASYLDHHRELRGELDVLRRQGRRGRPRIRLYVYMVAALAGMVLLIFLGMRS